MRLRTAKKILKRNPVGRRYGSGNTRDAFAKVLSSEIRKRGWPFCFNRMEKHYKYHTSEVSAATTDTNKETE